MLDDPLNLFDFSCQGKSGPPIGFGIVFIFAGCLTIMMGLVFYYACFISTNTCSDGLNDECANTEGLSREVSNT